MPSLAVRRAPRHDRADLRATRRARVAGRPAARFAAWAPLAPLVLVEIAYPLAHGRARAALAVSAVCLGCAISLGHAFATRGPRTGLALLAIATGGGLAVEALGVATGFPFGGYAYSAALGPRLAGVPLVIPLAWAWMAWPSRLVAARLARGRAARVLLAAVALASWDLFLDPQMVAEGYWRWARPAPGLAGVPLTNYLGWLAVAAAMMALLAAAAGESGGGAAAHGAGGAGRGGGREDAPMLALYLWTYASSALAHAVFLDLPASAAAGAVGMGLVAVPLAIRLCRR